MEGYDTRTNIKEKWTYSELLEMILIEDIKAINQYKAEKAHEKQMELERMLNNG